MEHALICPQCKAPLTPHRFASQVTCSYCGTVVQLDESAVPTEPFHQAFKAWNSPEQYAFSAFTSIGDRHWAVEELVARGDSADLHAGRLARWPTEKVLLKVLRHDQADLRLINEWKTLQLLQKSQAKGAAIFLRQIPQPILHGTATAGSFAGQKLSVFRWASGFRHNLSDVNKAYPGGIKPQAAIWVWRRILETCTFLHASGVAHGAIVPDHLVLQQNEHGIRLVGFGYSGRLTDPLPRLPEHYLNFCPPFARSLPKLTAQMDVVMSARCIIQLLGGDPETTKLPAAIPAPLADFLKKTANAGRDDPLIRDAWSIHQELGSISARVFGPPSYYPIVMKE